MRNHKLKKVTSYLAESLFLLGINGCITPQFDHRSDSQHPELGTSQLQEGSHANTNNTPLEQQAWQEFDWEKLRGGNSTILSSPPRTSQRDEEKQIRDCKKNGKFMRDPYDFGGTGPCKICSSSSSNSKEHETLREKLFCEPNKLGISKEGPMNNLYLIKLLSLLSSPSALWGNAGNLRELSSNLQEFESSITQYNATMKELAVILKKNFSDYKKNFSDCKKNFSDKMLSNTIFEQFITSKVATLELPVS